MRLLPRTDPSPLQRDLRVVTLAWAFGSAWLWIVSGAVMTRFVKAAGMPDWGFGFLAAIPFLGALSQLPASWWINARGGRRTLFLVLGSVGRAGFTAAAALPWLLPESVPAWPGVVALLLLAWSCMQATGPAWMNWMSDLIPRRIRGRYFARRANLVTPVALVASLGSAWLLDASAGGDAGRGAALGAHFGDGGAGRRAGGGRHPAVPAGGGPRTRGRRSTANGRPSGGRTSSRRFGTRTSATFWGSTSASRWRRPSSGRYLWLYVLDAERGLGWSNLKANFLIIAVPMVLALFTRPWWGRMCDRRGKKPVVLLSGFLACFGAVGWGIMTPELFWPGYLVVLLTTMAWPGLELANFNFLLEFSRDADRSRRDERGAGAQAAAILSVATAAAGGLSGLIGGVVAGTFRDWSLPWALPAWLPLGPRRRGGDAGQLPPAVRALDADPLRGLRLRLRAPRARRHRHPRRDPLHGRGALQQRADGGGDAGAVPGDGAAVGVPGGAAGAVKGRPIWEHQRG